MKSKLLREQDNPDVVMFTCPGCECGHRIRVRIGTGPHKSPSWEWNGSLEAPTFKPSILVEGQIRCHSFVTNGKIQFLADCSHKLAGQTVELPNWE